MKSATTLALVLVLLSCAVARAEDAAVKIYDAPLLAALDDDHVIAAIRKAFSQAPFQSAPGPGADVLTLTVPDGARNKDRQISFTVVFTRDGKKLGESFESCAVKTPSDCSDQLVQDVKSAAAQ